ncbi:MAG: AAA family ATPase [Leptospira sp.]|nr:AAA family ATPase [Leptospira sp.]
MNDKTLLLLRGLPGSGKSTFANLLAMEASFLVCSLDEYFTDEKGNYKFDFRSNHLAYKNCQDKVEAAMKSHTSKILVDQIFALLFEIEPYFKLAEKYNFRTIVCTLENRHKGENIHAIPDEQLVKMAKGFKVELLPDRLR